MANILTPWLQEKIQAGEALLFLGAGASRGSSGPKGETPLSGFELRDRVSENFLGGQHKDKPLARVAEYAKNESSLPEVQAFVKSLFLPLQPAPFHKLVAQFRWFALVTTNYDLVMERAYEQSQAPLQHLRSIIRDGDDFSTILKDNTAVPYLKLHGCLTCANDQTLPLILASEEYAKHKQNRQRLFMHFADWARERPVIFAGYDISDPNIQQILFDLSDLGVHRPTYAVIDPGLDDIAIRYWQARRFVPAAVTFEYFLDTLNQEIPHQNRILASLRSRESLSISAWIVTHVRPTDALVSYLDQELTHVHPGVAVTGFSPKEFYAGLTLDWHVFERSLDVKRRVADEILLDAFLSVEKESTVNVFLLRGHAGAGVSVLLRRVAWDGAKDFAALAFVLREGGVVRPGLLLELAQLTRVRILLIVDDAIPHLNDLRQLIVEAKKNQVALSVVLGARTNEWNVSAQDMDHLLDQDYELKDLSEREIEDLLQKLTLHRCLGELEQLTKVQQAERFRLHADRQLLVALHEATTGKPFEEIVLDEYEHVIPLSARVLYLDICTLHRLGVAVRAGLVSRVSGITFEHFNNELFKPLEHVVKTYFDSASRDYVYRTRNSLIAEFVFRQALPDATERAGQIKRLIRHMDVDYESDRDAFTRLIRGKTVADLFADKRLAWEIFSAAEESGAPKSFINHQKAVFELNHPHGNMSDALEFIGNAENALQQRDRTIEHTKAVIMRRLALDTSHPLQKARYRAEAKKILQKLTSAARTSHPLHTYAQVLIDDFKDKLEELQERGRSPTELEERGIAELARQAEESIFGGLQQFPADEFLLTLDAEFAELLQNNPRALTSLEHAFKTSPGRAFVAIRLARAYRSGGRDRDAMNALEGCIASNPSSKECHLELAKAFIRAGEEASKAHVAHHLRRSFTEGDSNFDAQFWCARHEYLYGNQETGMKMFEKLAQARTSPNIKRGARALALDSDAKPRWFSGYVKTLHESYCFMSCSELRHNLYIASHRFHEEDWPAVRQGALVRTQLVFSLRGPQGSNAELL